jgi:hypothetical protein
MKDERNKSRCISPFDSSFILSPSSFPRFAAAAIPLRSVAGLGACGFGGMGRQCNRETWAVKGAGRPHLTRFIRPAEDAGATGRDAWRDNLQSRSRRPCNIMQPILQHFVLQRRTNARANVSIKYSTAGDVPPPQKCPGLKNIRDIETAPNCFRRDTSAAPTIKTRRSRPIIHLPKSRPRNHPKNVTVESQTSPP